MSAVSVAGERDYLKWAFFAVMAACALLVVYVDERFLVTASDPEWRHIAPFEWLLLPHGIFGATALFLGPFQFSGTLRRTHIRVHRWTGRIYVGAILCVAAPLGLWIGVHFEPRTIYIEQYFQAGLWWLTTLIAFICIRNKMIAQHKLWMMRSYGFCLVFVLSRVPDAFTHMSHQVLADVLWTLVVAALILPDIILLTREGLRDATKRRAVFSGRTRAA